MFLSNPHPFLRLNTHDVTPRTALEALTHAKFSSASDVWSYAVTLWEIYSLGEIPWKGLNPIEIRDCLVRGERLGCPERCPREIYHVMTSSWEARPQDRPTFTSIYQTLKRVWLCIGWHVGPALCVLTVHVMVEPSLLRTPLKSNTSCMQISP